MLQPGDMIYDCFYATEDEKTFMIVLGCSKWTKYETEDEETQFWILSVYDLHDGMPYEYLVPPSIIFTTNPISGTQEK